MKRLLRPRIALCMAIILAISPIAAHAFGQKEASRFTTSRKVHISAPSAFTISRKGKGDVTVSWKKKPYASGYEIQVSSDKDFTNAKTFYLHNGNKEKVLLKASKISTKKNTYFRLRAFQYDGSRKLYSSWSRVAALLVWKTSWKYATDSKIHTDCPVLYYALDSKKNGHTVVVNAGHGTKGGESKLTKCHPDGTPKVTGGSTKAGVTHTTSINSGTTIKGKSEASLNLKIAKRLRNSLLSEGYNVLMIRQSDDMQLDNIARTVYANQYGDAHISIHYDSTTNNKGAFYTGVPDIRSYRNMKPVKDHWKSHENLGKNLISGLKRSHVKIFSSGRFAIDLTQTSYSTIPSVDLEVGDKGSSISTRTHKKIVNGIVEGLNLFFTSRKK